MRVVYVAERAANVVRSDELERQLRRYGVLACTRASIIGDATMLITLRSAEQKSRSPAVWNYDISFKMRPSGLFCVQWLEIPIYRGINKLVTLSH